MSREIDALVAETVMGCSRADTGPIAWGCWCVDPQSGDWIARPFSTEPSLSKKMRDRMRGLGWNYRITVQITGRIDATFQRGTHAENWGYAERESDTEEMAVALAALAAFGIEAPTE